MCDWVKEEREWGIWERRREEGEAIRRGGLEIRREEGRERREKKRE